jgi:HEAT repeat protein
VLLVAAGVIGFAGLALYPWWIEQRLIWQVEDEKNDDWRVAADALIEARSERGLSAVVAAALTREPVELERVSDVGFVAWREKIWEAYHFDCVLGIEGFTAALESSSRETRHRALEELRHDYWDAPEAVPVLVRALESSDQALRWQAAFVLHEFGAGAVSEAVGPLIRALSDPSEDVRWSAARALGALAPVSMRPVDALIVGIDDQSTRVALRAIRSLGQFGPILGTTAAPAAKALEEALRKDTLRAEAARALVRIGEEARGSMDVIVEMFESGVGWYVQSEPDFFDSPLPESIPPGSVSSDDHHAARAVVAEAIAEFRPGVSLSLRVLTALVDPKEAIETRQEAFEALGRLGADAASSVPLLIRALEDPETTDEYDSWIDSARFAAARALSRIGAPAVPALIDSLRVGTLVEKTLAAVALSEMGPQARPAAAALRGILANHEQLHDTVVVLSAAALASMDPSFDPVPTFFSHATDHRVLGLLFRELNFNIGRASLASLSRLLEFMVSADEDRSGSAGPYVLVALARAAPEETVPKVLAAIRGVQDPEKKHALMAGLLVAPRLATIVTPVLIEILDSDSENLGPLVASFVFRRFGPQATEAIGFVADLISRFDSDEESMSSDAFFATPLGPLLSAAGAIAPAHPVYLEFVERHFYDVPATGLILYLEEVARWGTSPPALISLLERGLAHRCLEVRVLSAWILCRTRGATKELLDVLADGLADQAAWNRHLPASRPSFYRSIDTSSPFTNRVRRQAARAVAEIGRDARSLTDALIDCAETEDYFLVVNSIEALSRVSGEARARDLARLLEHVLYESLPNQVVIEIYGDDLGEPAFLAREVFRVLRAMGPDAQVAVPILEEYRATPGITLDRAELDEVLTAIRGSTR